MLKRRVAILFARRFAQARIGGSGNDAATFA
jgi:hypothetical protein